MNTAVHIDLRGGKEVLSQEQVQYNMCAERNSTHCGYTRMHLCPLLSWNNMPFLHTHVTRYNTIAKYITSKEIDKTHPKYGVCILQ